MSQAQRIAMIAAAAKHLNPLAIVARRALAIAGASEEAAEAPDQVDPRGAVTVGDFAALEGGC